MQIKEKFFDDIAVVSMKGNLLGGDETQQMKDKIQSLIHDGVKKIVLDLKGVTWMNSTGLGALISCYTSAKNQSGDLRLSHLSEKVHNLFIITKLLKVFKVFETTERAIASFKSK
ncbi:MAG: STAS domain-containing protein [Ignavibacteriales bacterium]|nr:STAS domain-containing protein [Ignavibacteriales bacterium]